MSQLERLREMCEITKSMAQPTRHPIVIATSPAAPNSCNTVRAILGSPLLVRHNNGFYARDEKGHLVLDQMAIYKANREAAPSDYSLDDVKFSDYVDALTKLPASETPFRRMQLRPRRNSTYEMALWGGIMLGGRTHTGAVDYALRQAIQKTIPKAKPYQPPVHYARHLLGKSRCTEWLCNEYMPFHNKHWGMTNQERKLQEILDDRFRIDSIRLSTEFTKAYAQLPRDERYTSPVSSYAKYCRIEEAGVYHSTGHWDKRMY